MTDTQHSDPQPPATLALAKAAGYEVDTYVYPHVAYMGARFAPSVRYPVPTETEEKLLSALDCLIARNMLPPGDHMRIDAIRDACFASMEAHAQYTAMPLPPSDDVPGKFLSGNTVDVEYLAKCVIAKLYITRTGHEERLPLGTQEEKLVRTAMRALFTLADIRLREAA